MRSACRNLCIAWLCGAGLLGVAVAQQKQPADAAAQADAAKKVDAAKAAATDIERLETARAALAAQRNALANAAKENAARAQLDQKQAAAADQQRKTAVAEAAAQVQKIITQLHAAEAAGGQGNEKTIADLQKQRADALAAYRALLAAVPAVVPPPVPAAVVAAQPQAVVNVQVVGDANNALMREMLNRLRPILKVELGFVNLTCQLNDQQRKAIVAAGEESLQTAAQQYAAWQQSGQRGRVVVVNGRATRAMDSPKPRQMIQDGIAKAVKDHLPAEMAAQYAHQSEQRNEYRKHLTVDNLVNYLDDKLVLSSTQRDAISKALAAAWDDSWVSQLQLLSNGNQFVPSIPDQCIVPHLRDSQRNVWQAIPNRNNQVMFDDLQIQSGVTFDDGMDGEVNQ
jgi:hypothetical protein